MWSLLYFVVFVGSVALAIWGIPRAHRWYLNDQAKMRDQEEELEARRQARIELRMQEYLDEERFR
ncbi:hypothetical protein G3I13_01720 [Streptomyces sp. SID6673]|nr:hypothetical protein [Streptomyces sp. SID11726]NDZ94879.1 hypothetical protein [Streptomyces sp. SID11726]NEB23039.1 hypothetical protein [Streptomyces sp. SID6673]